ncbi:MAG: MarR family transcriptional regulator [Eubacterium sp.]|nr:MarR family transcriptional regulator [Eubacterium sp.]
MQYQDHPGEQLFTNFNNLKKSLFRFFSAQAESFKGMKQSEVIMLMRIAHRRCADGEAADEGIRISELSRLSRSSMPAVSQTIRGLEVGGLVTRATSDKDRRAVLVRLTPKGQAFVSAAPQAFIETFDQICGILGDEKTAQLTALTDELCHILEDFTDGLKASKNTTAQ